MGFWARLFSLVLLGTACGGTSNGEGSPELDPETGRPTSCPATSPAPHPLPRVTARQRTAAYWLDRDRAHGDPDAPLLDANTVLAHRRGLELPFAEEGAAEGADEGAVARPLGWLDLAAAVDTTLLEVEVRERLEFMREKIAAGDYLDDDGERLDEEARAAFATPAALPALRASLHTARERFSLRCGPDLAPLFDENHDPAFDRNACSVVREGELVQKLARWPSGAWLARTPYAMGFIADDAPLSATLSAAAAEPLVHPPTSAITRRAVIERAFALLDSPYGWGGHEGGRDCSAFLMDVFSSFGLGLPRHSARQALAGTYSVDVSTTTSEQQKLQVMDAALADGIVLLHFPGHIMLYLGRADDDAPMAIHSFSEYLERCDPPALPDGSPAETLRRVDRVTVSDLELGRGTTRTSFLERITRVSVIGTAPGPAVEGGAELRQVAPVVAPPEEACSDSMTASIWRSPAQPYAGHELKVIVTTSAHPGPVELAIFDPSGARVETRTRRLGGPPYGYWTSIERPVAGRYTAVLGDGPRIVACERFGVGRGPFRPAPPGTHAWESRWAWEEDTESLYAVWVEQLFDYPFDEDLTWPNLQTLLRDRERNLLFDHRALGEDAVITLGPDCADLPYFLRAYFSWKVELPFAFRRCSRGREGVPPACNELNSNLAPRGGVDDVSSFTVFMRSVASGVHSASARTAPADDDTDVYPVPLDRRWLRPGTVYADPYGHLLVLADVIPQGVTDYGVIVGADAQPDGTIGRRRFWRGSFLFTPETRDVGAGWKAWRPLVYDARADTTTSLDNAALRRSRTHAPWSDDQYTGTADEFYDRMEAIINPRPLDPEHRMTVLVDALEEVVIRRIVSVDNAVEYMDANGWRTIPMPSGYDVFETTGPWEDFSTPARDMRLLVSIDAVVGFPASIERAPSNFGLEAEEAAQIARTMREGLDGVLAARRFEYRKSDGAMQALTLADVVARAPGFEVSYNPNDCTEVRWAAPEGSDEMRTCRRHAPRDQQALMDRYREWFHGRRRPPR